ncbi:MAG: hypothetical protein Q9175_000615, partial [Cornicularia normoerica]
EYLDERIHRHGDARKARHTERFRDTYANTSFHTDKAPDTLGSSRFGELDIINPLIEKSLSSIQDRDNNPRLEDTDFTNPFVVQISLRDGKMPRKPLFRSTTSYELSVQRLYEKIIARTRPTNTLSDHLHRPEFPTQRNKCLYSSASATSNQAPTTSRMQPPDSWIALSYLSPSQQVSPITGMRRCRFLGRTLRLGQGPAPAQVLSPAPAMPEEALTNDEPRVSPKSEQALADLHAEIERNCRLMGALRVVAANVEDVIWCLRLAFVMYRKPYAIYCDRGHHFYNAELMEFLRLERVAIEYSPSGSSKSTGMIEASNKLLEMVLRKQTRTDLKQEWDQRLPKAAGSLNSRIIEHLGLASTSILFGELPAVLASTTTLRALPGRDVSAWVAQLEDPHCTGPQGTSSAHHGHGGGSK